NALRAARATGAGPEDRVLVLGPGTIGLLTALFLRAQGAEVHLLGVTPDSLSFARSLGFTHVWQSVPDLPYDAVVDASTAVELPARALESVEPSGKLVYIGLAREPSLVDTRTLVLKDVTATGILSASPGLDAAIRAYAAGVVDPRPLVAATVGLGEVGAVLAGERPEGCLPGPKVLVDPAS
ncbi:zinc-binding dehydrogenase, partial [Streptomyces sp. S6]